MSAPPSSVTHRSSSAVANGAVIIGSPETSGSESPSARTSSARRAPTWPVSPASSAARVRKLTEHVPSGKPA